MNWYFLWTFFWSEGALLDLKAFRHTDTINCFDDITNNKMSIFCHSYYLRITFVERKQHDQKAGGGGNGLFGLHFHTNPYHRSKSRQELKQGRNLKAGADAEIIEGC